MSVEPLIEARRVVEAVVTALLDDDRDTAAALVQVEAHPRLLALVAAELAAYLLRGGQRTAPTEVLMTWRDFCLARETSAGQPPAPG